MLPLTRGAAVLSSRKMSDGCLTGFLRPVYRINGTVKKTKPTFHQQPPWKPEKDLILPFNYYPINNRHKNNTCAIFISSIRLQGLEVDVWHWLWNITRAVLPAIVYSSMGTMFSVTVSCMLICACISRAWKWVDYVSYVLLIWTDGKRKQMQLLKIKGIIYLRWTVLKKGWIVFCFASQRRNVRQLQTTCCIFCVLVTKKTFNLVTLFETQHHFQARLSETCYCKERIVRLIKLCMRKITNKMHWLFLWLIY
jgi:hypothetical protein